MGALIAMFADLIYFTAIEGATKLKKLEKIKTTEFERNIVPNVFEKKGSTDIRLRKQSKKPS